MNVMCRKHNGIWWIKLQNLWEDWMKKNFCTCMQHRTSKCDYYFVCWMFRNIPQLSERQSLNTKHLNEAPYCDMLTQKQQKHKPPFESPSVPHSIAVQAKQRQQPNRHSISFAIRIRNTHTKAQFHFNRLFFNFIFILEK